MSIFPPHVPALCGNVLALVEAALAALAAGPSSNQASPAAGEPKTQQHSDQRYEAGCQEVPIRDVGRVDRHHRRGPDLKTIFHVLPPSSGYGICRESGLHNCELNRISEYA